MVTILIISELNRNVKKHPFLFIISIVYLFIAFVCLEFLFLNINTFNTRSNSIFNHKDKNVEEYRLVDLANTSHIIRDYQSVKVLKKFYNKFISNDNYTYYESIKQPVYIANFKGNEVFYYDYEFNQAQKPSIDKSVEYSHVKQAYINYSMVEKFNISDNILEGSAFKSDDFIIEEMKEVPIIMGYEYLKYYKVGDLLKAKLSKDVYTSYRIIGFLKKDIPIQINGKLTFLDRYIITPSMNFTYLPKTEKDILFQGFLYLQKLNGFIKLSNNYSFQKFTTHFEQLRLEYNVFDFTILKYSPMEMSVLKFLVYENIGTLKFVFIVTFIATIITIFAYMIHKINLNMYTYKVLLICGYSIKDIKRIVMFEFCMTFAIPLILALFFLNTFMSNALTMSLVFIMVIYLALFLIIFVLTQVYFYNIGMEKLVKGDKDD